MPYSIAFSTLSCPTWDLQQILNAASQYGYQSLELRGYRDTMDLPTAHPFTPERRRQTKSLFDDAGIGICCISSSATAARGDVEHVVRHAELACDLGAPIVRVFGGAIAPGTTEADGLARAAENLRAFGDAASKVGVRIVLETHDWFSTGARAAALIDAADHPSVSPLWDLHHPFREGEPIAETYRYIGATAAHIHVKDSAPDGRYCLLGSGSVPVFEMLDLLFAGGYSGAVSVEWEKRWRPEIEAPEIALPQYASALRDYFHRRAAARP